MVRSAALLVTLLLGASSVSAQIYNCDGRWTNRPCKGVVERALEEVKPSEEVKGNEPKRERSTSPQHSSEPFAPRYDALRQLKKTSDNLTKSGKIGASRGEYETVRKLCMDREKTNAQCKEAVTATLASLEKKNEPQE